MTVASVGTCVSARTFLPGRMTGALALLLGVTSLCLGPTDAAAVLVYGGISALPGAGGCLRDPAVAPGGGAPCPGLADGLAGAQALAVSPDGSNVYAAGESAVVALARDSATGALAPALSPSLSACVASEPSSACAAKDAALGGADAIAVSPDGRFVYVGASNTAAVSAFARGAGGVLRALARSVDGYSGCVAGVALTGTEPARCAAHMRALRGVDALAISPDGRYLYAVSSGLAPGTDSVVTLERDAESGALRPLGAASGCIQSMPGRGCQPSTGLEGASAITISPDGRFVYVASELSGAVRAFARNRSTGVLTPLKGAGGCISSPVPAAGDVPCPVTAPQLAGARSLGLSSDGRELYVAAFEPGAVVILARDPRSGRLAPGPHSCLQALSTPACPTGVPFLRGAAALAVAPDGGAVYVASEGGNSLLELTRDTTDGALTLDSESVSEGESLSGPTALALAPGGRSLYIASPFEDGVAGFSAP